MSKENKTTSHITIQKIQQQEKKNNHHHQYLHPLNTILLETISYIDRKEKRQLNPSRRLGRPTPARRGEGRVVVDGRERKREMGVWHFVKRTFGIHPTIVGLAHLPTAQAHHCHSIVDFIIIVSSLP